MFQTSFAGEKRANFDGWMGQLWPFCGHLMVFCPGLLSDRSQVATRAVAVAQGPAQHRSGASGPAGVGATLSHRGAKPWEELHELWRWSSG